MPPLFGEAGPKAKYPQQGFEKLAGKPSEVNVFVYPEADCQLVFERSNSQQNLCAIKITPKKTQVQDFKGM